MAGFAEPAIERAASTAAVYDVPIDLDDPNSSHALMLQMVGHGKRVLEVGCAAGHVTKHLVANDNEVDGIEIDPVAASIAATIARRVVVADLDRLDFADDLEPESYDVILLGDVLEHTRSPADVLLRLSPLLKPDGYLVISVPNIAHADVRLMVLDGRWERFDWGLLDKTHLRFFTYDLLHRFLNEGGFVVTETRRVTRPIFETELRVDRTKVPTEVVDAIRADPEAETYQFIVSAARDNGDAATLAGLRRSADLEQRVHQLEREALATEQRHREELAEAAARYDALSAEHIEAIDDAITQLRGAGVDRDDALAAADRLRREVDDLRVAAAELEAIRRSWSYRASRPFAKIGSGARRLTRRPR